MIQYICYKAYTNTRRQYVHVNSTLTEKQYDQLPFQERGFYKQITVKTIR